ncbi:MAG: ATP-binding protein [Polyangiaceae bacterium]|nr:ATP-binding protein [Polyangiaceae bacterium]MCW5790166.1 ATP-binding protein [Polyangiaceae bacterium]
MGDAGVDLPEDLKRIRQLTLAVRALIAGELAANISPKLLFEIDIEDERAVQVERVRLAELLAAMDVALDVDGGDPTPKRSPDEGVGGGGKGVGVPGGLPGGKSGAPSDSKAPGGSQAPGAPGGGASDSKGTPRGKGPNDGPSVEQTDAGAPTDAGLDPSADPELLTARLELDRARLDFLSLPKDRRTALLAAHAERAAALKSAQGSSEKIHQAEEARAEAEKAQRLALEEAAQSKTEILRLLNEERARLLGVRVQQADYEKAILERQQGLVRFEETKLEWQRKTEEHAEARRKLTLAEAASDQMYFELRGALRSSRDSLRRTLDAIARGGAAVPSAGPEKVESAGLELDRAEYDTLRQQIISREAELRKSEHDSLWAEAKAQLELIESLNRNRLTLFSLMSSEQRSRLTSFRADGLDQGGAEVAQVALIIRYHVRAAHEWLRGPKLVKGEGVFATLLGVKLVLLLGVFMWWRRRADPLLALLAERAEHEARKSSPSLMGRLGPGAIAVLRRVRRPLETLLVLGLARSFLPPRIAQLLEVRVLWIIVSWVLVGSAVVLLIDALASRGAVRRAKQVDVSALRFRTLRVLGRSVVFFGLILALSSEIVGKGTLYDWVLSTCWLVSVPLALIFVGWWRQVIFTRLERQRTRSRLAAWVVANELGYRSSLAAAVGGAYLLGLGGVRIVREYLTATTVVRRVLAYLFRRELSKKAETRGKLTRIPRELYERLAPETESEVMVATAADQELAKLSERIDLLGGGVFAVVGERGSGKSALLRRVLAAHPESRYLRCAPSGAEDLRVVLRERLGLAPDASREAVVQALDGISEDNAILIDDAQRLVTPTIGGLAALDELLSLARDASSSCTWIFAFESTVFELIARARGTRPIFDDVIAIQPWREEAIAELLDGRTTAAGLTPSFEGLLQGDPDLDEEEHAERLLATRRGYYRLLWDYSSGNPAVALHFWRRSLGIDEDGELAVGLFTAPPTADLEALPDASFFVLRALLRLDPATLERVAESTGLPYDQILDAIRYADFRGYLARDEAGRLHITWTWFRAITRVLSRRHLLSLSL